jgi:hypothetical protein
MKTKISNNPKLPLFNRYVTPLMITYLDFVNNEAKIQVKVTHEDDQDVELGINKDLWIVLSNNNKVTDQGQMITQTSFPINDEESEEDYQIRFDKLLTNGYPEFTFWWENAKQKNIEQAIEEGILLLDQFQYFN